ncbi:MAG: hypothetical protein EHM45_06485 [Desulfobacteraceae bacterium]|nr:MAG: hypothetical protein EHM45_06485 [Desulfobacteraceae bacterium]
MQCPSCGNLKSNWCFYEKLWFCGVCDTYYNSCGFITEGPQKTKTRFARVEYDGAVVTVKIQEAGEFLMNTMKYLPVFTTPRVLKSITFYEEETR